MTRPDRRRILALGAGLALAGTPQHAVRAGSASAVLSRPDELLTRLLASYVYSNADGINRVDYKQWRANKANVEKLSAAISGFERMKPSTMSQQEAIAFWANLYNAVTLRVVLQRYPVASIRDIPSKGLIFDPQAYTGPWREKRLLVESKSLSLDDIEHKILRPLAHDPRVHYSVNCASLSCPNLQRSAWIADTLEQDLEHAAREYINHPRAVTVLPDGSLRVSSIYVWFKEDFDGDGGVISHLRQHAAPVLAKRLTPSARISADTYDWRLNDSHR